MMNSKNVLKCTKISLQQMRYSKTSNTNSFSCVIKHKHAVSTFQMNAFLPKSLSPNIPTTEFSFDMHILFSLNLLFRQKTNGQEILNFQPGLWKVYYSEMKFTGLYICHFLLITFRSRNQRNSILFKMNNTTCFNISTAAPLSQSNSTTLQNFNCTNGSATDNPKSTWNTFDLYSSTAKIIAYSTVYSIVSIIALAGRVNNLLCTNK
jgi:hypothetical protein